MLSQRIFSIFQAEEEARSLQKKIQTIENELDQTQEQLTAVNTKLEEKDKALQNVSVPF
jgi:tropomyosin-1